MIGRAGAGAPNANGELVAGSVGLVGVLKLKPVFDDDEVAPNPGKVSLRSAPDGGVAGAAPKAKGLDLPASGLGVVEVDSGAPKLKPTLEPPNTGLGAKVSVVEEDDVAFEGPNANGEVLFSEVLG